MYKFCRQIVLSSMSPEVDDKRLQLGSAVKNADGCGLLADRLTCGRQLRQLATTALRVVHVGVDLSANSLSRLVEAAEHQLLLGQQSRRQVVDESLVLLFNTRTRGGKQLLQNNGATCRGRLSEQHPMFPVSTFPDDSVITEPFLDRKGPLQHLWKDVGSNRNV